MAGPWDDYAEAPAPQPAAPAVGPWSSYQPHIETAEHIPPAMEERLIKGDEARKREGGLLQTIPQGIDMMSTPEGRTKIWEAVKKYPSKFVDDMINMAKLPGDVAEGKIDLSTEEGMDQAVGLGMLVGGSRLNKLSLTGKTSGLSVSMGETMHRIERGPTGEIFDLPIGGVARSEDFASASQIVGGPDAPFAVQEKLLKSYNEKGLHPSEVAFDAQTDAVTAQRLLSSDPADLPPGGMTPREAADLPLADRIGRLDTEAFHLKGAAPEFRDAIDAATSPVVSADSSVHNFPSAVEWSISNGRKDIADVIVERAETELGKRRAEAEAGPRVAKDDPRYETISERQKADLAAQEALVETLRSKYPDGISAPSKPPPPPPEGSFAAAEKTILDKISVNETAPKDRMTFDKFYRQAVDDLHPLKGVSEDAYQAARLTRGQFGKAEHFIEHGTFDFNTYKTNGKPLAEILEPVRTDLDGFRAYLASRRAIEIEASGRKSGMDLEAANKVVAEGGGKYGKLADELSGYQENVLKYLRDSGVLSEDSFKAMREANENYIPFYRVFEAGEGGGGAGKSFGPGNPIKKLKGSERDVIDPLESIIKNTYAYVSVAERNAVGIKLIDALKRDGAASKIERAGKDAELSAYLKENGVTNPDAIVDFVKAATPEDGTMISAFRNGVKESVKVNDPELVAAFRGLDQQSATMLTKVLAFPAKTLRAGSTLSPDFIARNVIRDFLTAVVNSKGALFSPVDTIKGLKSAITKDADFLDWLKGGGANSTMVALDRRYLQESLQKLTSETGLMERSWNVIKHPIETGLKPLRVVSELAENATRLGEFKKLRGETKESIQSAAYASREVTLDFARIGASMRAYNMVTAFGNAQIQGLDRIGRQFKTAPGETMLKVAGSITLPSVLLWWANKDDPRYKELPSWQRDMFWIVMTKDHIYRIPKPFELGVVFGSGVERILDATFGKNPDAFDKLSKSIMDVILPNYMPTAAQPLIEQFSNRSTFADRTLIPADMEKHLPEYQFTPYTTETAKALGKMVSAFPGMRTSAVGPGAPFGPVARAVTSPILLENYLRSWTGGMGTYALQAADAGLRKSGVLPDPVKPTATLSDIPVVRAFMVRYPSATTQSIQDFMDAHETNKRFFDTWSAKAKEGDSEAMERIQQAGGPMMFVRLDAIKETLGQHSKLVRDIYKNPTMKAEEKRQLIDSLYFNMIEIGKAGSQMVKESKKALTAD